MINQINIRLPQGNISALINAHENENPQVLAIHGWLDNAASFVPLIDTLPEYNWTAIDLPGHGHSFHRPLNSYYHFIDWVFDLVSLIKERYKTPVILVGHSLGGMLATVIAGVYPELVHKLVLIDAAGLVTHDPKSGVRELRDALESRNVSSEHVKSFALQSAVKARSRYGDISQPSAQLLVSRNTVEIGGSWQWRSDKRLKHRSPVRISEQQAKNIINNINSPTLLCLADSGYSSIRDNYHKFKDDYKRLTKVDVIGSHHCHMDQVSETALAISQFITKV